MANSQDIERAELIRELEESAKFCDGTDTRTFAARFRKAAALLEAQPAEQSKGQDVAATVQLVYETDPRNSTSCADLARVVGVQAVLHQFLPPGTKLYAAPPTPPVGVPDGWIDAVKEAIRALEVYESLPRHSYPGPPTTALAGLRAMLPAATQPAAQDRPNISNSADAIEAGLPPL